MLQTERLYQLYDVASRHYHDLLLSKRGDAARAYFSERKITLDTINEFHLGYSPSNITEFMVSMGFPVSELISSGLASDRFYNRLIFPICDTKGRVVAFGGRALGESQPKYTNSHQTPIFDKSSCLYGFNKAEIVDSVVVVEGYFDVLIAHQHGYRNVVASMGTAVTEKQSVILRRLSRNIILALDADTAGQKAILRSASVFARCLNKKVLAYHWGNHMVRYLKEIDADIRVIPLPEGSDPDDVIRENIELWRSLEQNAVSLIDFAFTMLGNTDKAKTVIGLMPLIRELRDPEIRSQYIQRLSEQVHVSSSILFFLCDETRKAMAY